MATVESYRRCEQTLLCASCQTSEQRTPATRECPACATPYCDRHGGVDGEICQSCADTLARRQQRWGFASTRAHIALWSSLLVGVLLVFGAIISACPVALLLEHHTPATFGLMLLFCFGLPISIGVAKLYRARHQQHRSKLDELLFSVEQRRRLERRRARRAR
jgi:hypothetical protein